MRHRRGWARQTLCRALSRRLLHTMLVMAAGFALAAAGTALAGVTARLDRPEHPGNEDVTICHGPGTPAEHTIVVSRSALDAHLRHGDYEGACTPPPTTTTTPTTTTSTTTTTTTAPPPPPTTEPPTTTTTTATTTTAATTTEPTVTTQPAATTTAATTTQTEPPQPPPPGGSTVPVLAPDLRLSVSVTPSSGSVGRPITFTYRLTNVGTGEARSVEIRVLVPSNATLVSVALARFTGQPVARRRLAIVLDPACSVAGAQVTCALGTVAPAAGGTVTMTVTPTVPGSLSSAGSAVSAETVTAATSGSAEIAGTTGAFPGSTATGGSEPPPSDSAGADQPLPAPTGGVNANVVPVAGTVLVNGRPLTQGEQVPLGVPIDTTNGIVQITTIGSSGVSQSAFFFGGVFVLQQSGPTAVTDVLLQGGDAGICAVKKSKRSLNAKAPKAKKSKKVIRSLWGQGSGSFRTRGKYSSATVRGTSWLTADRCDGTLTRVEDGSVTVNDFVKRRTIIVTAGHSYLATAP